MITVTDNSPTVCKTDRFRLVEYPMSCTFASRYNSLPHSVVHRLLLIVECVPSLCLVQLIIYFRTELVDWLRS